MVTIMSNKPIFTISLVIFILQVSLLAASDNEEQQEVNKTISVPLKSTPDGELFYIEAQVGQEAEKVQTFNLLLSTVYHTTWLPSLELSPKRGYSDPTTGDLNHNEFIIRKTGAGYGEYSCRVHNNTWKIGFHTVENQSFALAYPRGPFTRYFSPESKLDGVLSLAGRQRYDHDPEYLFRNLSNVGLIDHLKFSLYIDNKPDKGADATKGALVLGGIDHSYYTGEFRYASMQIIEFSSDPYRPPLKLSTILLDWSRTTNATKAREDLQRLLPGDDDDDQRLDLLTPSANVYLDTSTKLFVGVKHVLDKIHLDFIGATNVGSTILARGGLYVFDDCRLDNKPDLVFLLDDVELVLTPEDYVIRTQIDGSRACVSALKPLKLDSWVFGTRLLRKYYTVFDYETNTVGFATPV